MIKGLIKFREHFAIYQNHYALIGGVASSLVLENAGVSFRQTKDFDMVLCVEALDRDFAEAFWEFVRLAGYQSRQQSSGHKIFYRFENPTDENYPVMLELFSRNPELIQPAEGSRLTPVPIDEEVSSLSAILLDVDYYGFLKQQTAVIDGVSVVTEIGLIPLKVKAWLDMSRRTRDGEAIDSRKIKKHKNDVFRLFQIISPDVRVSLPGSIVADMADFIVGAQKEQIDLKQLGLGSIKQADLIASLIRVYQIPGYDQLFTLNRNPQPHLESPHPTPESD
ncbi:MAG: hypothetical protein Q7V56_04880 [Gammaproteobacteria bacterium]|nr:hypothetical protein [Gammaproteobacteria bacterium]